MRRVMGFVAATGASLLVGNAAQAVVIVNDNFEGYTSQANFEATWAPIGTAAPTSGTWSTAQSASATHSIHNAGETTVNGEARNRRTFTDTGTLNTGPAADNFGVGDKIIFSFNFWDAGTTVAPNPQRNYSNLQDTTAPSATNQLISMGLNNTIAGTADGGNFFMARILGYAPPAVDPDGGAGNEDTAAGNYFKLNDTGVGLRGAAGWHNLRVEITSNNLAQGFDYKFYVNNLLAETVNNVGTATSVRGFDNIAMGSGFSNGGIQAYFDDMYLEYVPVPEPTSLALLGIGGLAMLRRRRA